MFQNELPSNAEIIEMVEKAKIDALKDLNIFGLQLQDDELELKCKLEFKNVSIDFEDIEDSENELNEACDIDNDIFNISENVNESIDLQDLSVLANITGDLQLKSFRAK